MSNQNTSVTLASLANINELVRFVTHEVMGNEISNTIADSPVSRSIIYNMVQSRIRVNFSRFNGVL